MADEFTEEGQAGAAPTNAPPASNTALNIPTMSLTEAVNVLQQASNFVRHLAQVHAAGFAIMQAQQGSEDLMRLRVQLEGDITRLRDTRQTLTDDLERDKLTSRQEETRMRADLEALSRQLALERAEMSDEFDAWKARLDDMRAIHQKEHDEALQVINSQRKEAQEQLDAVRSDFAAMQERLRQLMG